MQPADMISSLLCEISRNLDRDISFTSLRFSWALCWTRSVHWRHAPDLLHHREMVTKAWATKLSDCNDQSKHYIRLRVHWKHLNFELSTDNRSTDFRTDLKLKLSLLCGIDYCCYFSFKSRFSTRKCLRFAGLYRRRFAIVFLFKFCLNDFPSWRYHSPDCYKNSSEYFNPISNSYESKEIKLYRGDEYIRLFQRKQWNGLIRDRSMKFLHDVLTRLYMF